MWCKAVKYTKGQITCLSLSPLPQAQYSSFLPIGRALCFVNPKQRTHSDPRQAILWHREMQSMLLLLVLSFKKKERKGAGTIFIVNLKERELLWKRGFQWVPPEKKVLATGNAWDSAASISQHFYISTNQVLTAAKVLPQLHRWFLQLCLLPI